MKKETLLATTGCCKPEEQNGIVNLPPFRASTILFSTLADFDMAERGEWPLPSYGRNGTPSTLALEKAIAGLEGAEHCVAYASGMAAITASMLAFVKTGDHVLVADSVYGPTRRLCNHELKRFGVETTYYDPAIGADIAGLIRDNTRVVYCESPGSLTFEMQDIPAIAKAAHARGAIVISDNTWATPLHFRALEHGVDISVQSVTKYMAGHSDLVMGAASCQAEHYKALLNTSRNLGASPAADNCYLAMRGLRTMAVRLKQHEENARTVIRWLQTRLEIARLIYPALEGDAGYALWKRDMTGACGLFAMTLNAYPPEALARMMDGMELFHMGYSWGGYESLMIPIYPERIRSATKWEHNGPSFRLHIGLENPDDLIRDLERGFARLNG